MQETTNYKLKKIELSDSPPDITVINPNWDLIDDNLKRNSENLELFRSENTIKTYYSLLKLGLDDSNFQNKSQVEISDIIVNAMPNNSILKYRVDKGNVDSNLINLIPTTDDGILSIFKNSNTGTEFYYLTHKNIRYESYYGSWKTPHLQKWKQITSESENLNLVNSWEASWEGTEPVIAKSCNIVTVVGIIKGGVTTQGATIATVPVQYRPSNSQSFLLRDWSNSITSSITINNLGNIVIAQNNQTTWDNTKNIMLNFTYILEV